jgi:hypothetical protein
MVWYGMLGTSSNLMQTSVLKRSHLTPLQPHRFPVLILLLSMLSLLLLLSKPVTLMESKSVW